MDRSVVSKIIMIILCINLVIFMGSFGYIYIEGYSFLDAIYMTVITLTTTGYQEVIPLSDTGRIFTTFLLLSGMGVVTYCLTTIINHILSIDFSKRRREKMEKRISSFTDHTIVCGYGRMGEIICKKLAKEGVTFVVIEKKEFLVKLLKKVGYHYLEGDAAHDDNLLKAGIEKAKFIVSVIDSDADGLYIALASRSFNPDINIIVRANEPSAEKRMIRAGANKVVLPFVMSGLRVAESVIHSAVEDFFSIPDSSGSSIGYVQMGDLLINEKPKLVGKKLKDIGHKLEGIIIVGIRKKDNSFLFKPTGSYIFQQDDCLIIIRKTSSFKEAQDEFDLEESSSDKYLNVG